MKAIKVEIPFSLRGFFKNFTLEVPDQAIELEIKDDRNKYVRIITSSADQKSCGVLVAGFSRTPEASLQKWLENKCREKINGLIEKNESFR